MTHGRLATLITMITLATMAAWLTSVDPMAALAWLVSSAIMTWRHRTPA